MELTAHRPRILLLIDTRGWAFHTIATAIMAHLGDRFSFTLLASDDRPVIDESAFDIIHIFYDFETYHLPFLRGHAKIMRSVYSHYWQDRGMSADTFYAQYLRDAHAIVVPSKKLHALLQNLPPAVALCPEGVDTDVFRPRRTRTGPLIAGWAGDPTRAIKRLPWLQEACEGICELRIADGTLTQIEMVDFYNDIDVVACSSIAEGCPRPVLEGMACGCYPVTFDVGIAAEIIADNTQGLIVDDASIAALRDAMRHCVDRTAFIRSHAESRASCIASVRSWERVLPMLEAVYRDLACGSKPRCIL